MSPDALRDLQAFQEEEAVVRQFLWALGIAITTLLLCMGGLFSAGFIQQWWDNRRK